MNVDVSPTILNWVMEKIPFDDLEDKIKDQLRKWHAGEKTPTFGQIENVSKATHIPLGYFFLKIPPKEDYTVLGYRTIKSKQQTTTSRNLIDTINNMEAIQDWMRDYILSSGNDRLSFVGSMQSVKDVTKIAAAIRADLGLAVEWQFDKSIRDHFKFLRNIVSEAGVLVMQNGIVGQNTRRPLDIEEFRAFTLIDEYAPLIFINGNDTQNGKVFSLLHETAHIWIGIDCLYNDIGLADKNIAPAEILCNAVAAELLVPDVAFVEKWNAAIKKSATKRNVIHRLSEDFACSAVVIARKALNHKFITAENYSFVEEDTKRAYLSFQKKEGAGGDFYRTNAIRMDHKFIMALNNSIQEGKTLSTDAYALSFTSRKSFPKLVEQIRGTYE